MRLTEKADWRYFPKRDEDGYLHNSMEIENKLGQLEDLEDELGIDLITLFKALKDGICEKEGHSAKESIRFIPNNCLVFDDEFLYELKYCKGYTRLVRHFYLKDYGKTWALTKEELL